VGGNSEAIFEGAEQFPLDARSLALLMRVKNDAAAEQVADGPKPVTFGA
jgi:hypothetical protein